MRRAAMLALCLGIILPHASPSRADDLATCRGSDPDARMAACSRMIARGARTGRLNLAEAHNQRGVGYYQRGDLDSAIREVTEAIRISPQAVFYNNRGGYLAHKGDWEKGLADLDRSIAMNPNNPNFRYNKGVELVRKGETSAGLSEFDQAIAMGGKYPTYFFTRGIVLFALGQTDRAIRDFDEAIRRQPDRADYYSGRGLARYAKSDIAGATADLDRAIRLDPAEKDAFVLRATLKESKGLLEEAISDYREALRPARIRFGMVGKGNKGEIELREPISAQAKATAKARLAVLSEGPTSKLAAKPPEAVAVPPAAPDDRFRRKIALVIGNAAYPGSAALANPANDARDVASQLRAMGFDVTTGIDLDRKHLGDHVRDFLLSAPTARVALLYYAGHGVQVDNRNYLVPVDVHLGSAMRPMEEMTALDTIVAALNDPLRSNVIILDACRNNPFDADALVGAAEAGRSVQIRSGLASPSAISRGAGAGAGTLIAFATAPGEVALDGDGHNSPFSASLARHIGTVGLEVQQMLTRVRAEVVAATKNRQVPWSNSSLLGEVYLVDR